MNGFQYAWEEVRLYAAQVFIGLAVKATPANTPEMLLLYDFVGKWAEAAKREKWKPGDRQLKEKFECGSSKTDANCSGEAIVEI